jgi:hypothetical protein
VRPYGQGPIAQSNHYQLADHEKFNGIVDTDRSMLMRTSRERARVLQAELEGLGTVAKLDDVVRALAKPPVENEETRQKMVFCPARGELRVWREIAA